MEGWTMWKDYCYVFCASLLAVLLVLPRVHGTQEECDVNLCNVAEPGFLCEPGSIILIKEVMCRTDGQNCDEIAYREVTRLCSGLQLCETSDLWLIHGKYCLHPSLESKQEEILSVVFVSYVCVSNNAIEGNCSEDGMSISPDQRYISSPGYPDLITGSSVCLWTLSPPPGFDVDMAIREYLLRDDQGKLFLRIKETNKNGLGMKFDRTSQKGLTFTLSGDVEILLFAHDPKRAHRVWIEYRFVPDTTLEHLRPFLLPNRTECGTSLLNSSLFLSGANNNNNHSGSSLSSAATTPSDSTTATTRTRNYSTRHLNPTQYMTTTAQPEPTPSSPNITRTGVGNIEPPDTGITISVVVCTIGIACCVVAIWVMRKHRHGKVQGRGVNCLISDSYSLEFDRASLASTPSSSRYPHIGPAQLVGINHPPLDIQEILRRSEAIRQKKYINHSSSDIEKSTDEPSCLSNVEVFPTIDFKKYLISIRQNSIEESDTVLGV